MEGLLSHLNGVRPSIRFTVEVERDGRLPFLDTLLQRRNDGSLDVTVYRKPTHTDRYLDFKSHHPSHVKRGLVRCLYDRARSITTRQDNLKKKEFHLAEVLKQNGYPSTFVCSSSIPSRRDVEITEAPLPEEGRRPPLVMLPHTEGVSEDIRWVCRKFGLKDVFRSGLSSRSMLTRVKDTLAMEKRSKVVYQIPCSCGKKYIGETVRRLETRMKEHRDACQKGTLEKSALAEHAWENRHPIKWEEATVTDQARTLKELLLKETIHIRLQHPHLNRDGRLELLGCWMAALKGAEARVNRRQPATSGDTT